MIGRLARLAVDNPKPLLLTGCGSYVLGRVVLNAVRPKSVGGVLACAVTSYALSAWLADKMIARGLLEFRIRDEDGDLVLIYPKADA